MANHHEVERFVVLRSPELRQNAEPRIPTHPSWAEATQFLQAIEALGEERGDKESLAVAHELIASGRFVRQEAMLQSFRIIKELRQPGLTPQALSEILCFENVSERERFRQRLTEDWLRVGDSLVAATLAGIAGDPDATLDFQALLRLFQLAHAALELRRDRLLDQRQLDRIPTALVELPPFVFHPAVCLDLPIKGSGGTGDGVIDRCEEPSRCCPKVKPYVADLMTIQQDLVCYEAEELAYIENVLQGEQRQRKHRHLVRTETESEIETSTTSVQERDHQVSNRYQLSRAAETTTTAEAQLEAGVTLTAKYGKNLTLTSNFGISTASSKKTSSRLATEHARDVTERAKNRVEQSVREKNTTRRLEEVEERNKHVLANDGDEHQVGLYHWVSEVHKAQVMNYGRRLMVECELPEPSRLYRFFRDRHQEAKVSNLDPGPPPALDPSQISDQPNDPHHYLKLVDRYDLTGVQPPPAAEILVSATGLFYDGGGHIGLQTLTKGDGLRIHQFSSTLEVPSSYEAAELSARGSIVWGDGTPKSIVVTVGTALIQAQGTYNFNPAPMNGEQGTLDVHVESWSVTSWGLTVTLTCRRTAGLYEAWQLAVFERVMEAYSQKKERFELAQTEERERREDKFRARPYRFREREILELQRMFISCVSCQFYDDFDAMRDCVNPCKFPQMNVSEAAKEGRIVRFFHHALELESMTYLFYPYFWMNKCDWGDRLSEDSEDLLFRRFLQAGYARVQVPVRPGFEEVFLHYLETRQIWNRDDSPPCLGTPYCISMVDEVRQQQRFGQTFRDGCLDVVAGEESFTARPGTDLTTDDLNHEIVIDCTAYRIKDLAFDPDDNPLGGTLDRSFEGETDTCVPFAIGALFVGAPWKVRLPTELVYVPKGASCLPKYPLPPCEE